MFERGKSRHPDAGRKAGVPNKLTASVRHAISLAFDDLGGVPALVRWGQENPNLFYVLRGRLAPQEVDVTSNGQGIGALAVAAWARGQMLRQRQIAIVEQPTQHPALPPASLSLHEYAPTAPAPVCRHRVGDQTAFRGEGSEAVGRDRLTSAPRAPPTANTGSNSSSRCCLANTSTEVERRILLPRVAPRIAVAK